MPSAALLQQSQLTLRCTVVSTLSAWLTSVWSLQPRLPVRNSLHYQTPSLALAHLLHTTLMDNTLLSPPALTCTATTAPEDALAFLINIQSQVEKSNEATVLTMASVAELYLRTEQLEQCKVPSAALPHAPMPTFCCPAERAEGGSCRAGAD